MESYKNIKFVIVLQTVLLLTFLPGLNFAQTSRQNLNIVFIGNSITHGAGLADPEKEAPPAEAGAYLERQPGIGKVSIANQGYSGYTTVDFLPGTGKTFSNVEQAAKNFTDKSALLIFSIELGTNDSAIEGPNGSPVLPGAYRENLKIIADSLLKEFKGCIILFNHPVWYSPNTYNGSRYLQEGLTRLQSYLPQIDQLVEDYAATYPGQVFKGDKKGFNYFKRHHLALLQPEQGRQGIFYLHPNAQGAIVLGDFWGKAIYKAVEGRS